MVDKKLGGAGLRGQVAALCTVGIEGSGLTYRGYDVKDLAANCIFEEVAYLIFYRDLPNREHLSAYQARLAERRGLPQALREVLERIPANAHPMDVMRTGCSVLGNLETEKDFSEQQDIVDRILATLPGMVCYWHRFASDGTRIETQTDDATMGA